MLDRFPEDDECEQRAYAREWSRNARRRASAPRVEELEAPQPPFEISYRASRWERAWLQHSLQPFFDQGYLADVVSQVRGGKEANVYCCYGAPGVGMPLVAAKVYRPRMFRNLRNDRMYREGRTILTADGKGVKRSDHRIMRALGKKTEYGAQVQHTSWLMHEFATLTQFRAAGGSVPAPLAAGENAILMSYLGLEECAAPALHEVSLAEDEARRLYAEVLRNVELLLSLGLIHGDLSAFNLLYWHGDVSLIDFPQVVPAATNPYAEGILRRDVLRVCEYFARQGVSCDPEAEFVRLWEGIHGDTETI